MSKLVGEGGGGRGTHICKEEESEMTEEGHVKAAKAEESVM